MEESIIKCLLSWEESCGLSNTGSKLHSHIIDPKICSSELAVISLSGSVFIDPLICYSIRIVADQAETPKLVYED